MFCKTIVNNSKRDINMFGIMYKNIVSSPYFSAVID